MTTQKIDASRLQDLRDALKKLDPAGRRRWLLEIYSLRDGSETLDCVYDIKSGRPYRAKKQDIEEVAE